MPRERLVKLEKRTEAELKRQQEADVQNAEIAALREEVARLRQQVEATPETHDYSEADTRRYLIDLDLNGAGWKLDQPRDREYEVQGMLYADCLEQRPGQRPLIFYTNGYETCLWDDAHYPPRKVAGFYRKDKLERLIRRRDSRKRLDVGQIREAIAGRYYQKRAIGSICEA